MCCALFAFLYLLFLFFIISHHISITDAFQFVSASSQGFVGPKQDKRLMDEGHTGRVSKVPRTGRGSKRRGRLPTSSELEAVPILGNWSVDGKSGGKRKVGDCSTLVEERRHTNRHGMWSKKPQPM